MGVQWWPVDSPHKGPVMRKAFPWRDVVMWANQTVRQIDGLVQDCSISITHWRYGSLALIPRNDHHAHQNIWKVWNCSKSLDHKGHYIDHYVSTTLMVMLFWSTLLTTYSLSLIGLNTPTNCTEESAVSMWVRNAGSGSLNHSGCRRHHDLVQKNTTTKERIPPRARKMIPICMRPSRQRPSLSSKVVVTPIQSMVTAGNSSKMVPLGML